MSAFSDWFRCPYCGDEGEITPYMVGRNGGIEFTCESRDHLINTGFFNKFSRKERRERDSYNQSYIERFFNTDLMGELAGCLTCPDCPSSATDGAVEQLEIDNPYGTIPLITSTVWCHKCESVERKTLAHNKTPETEKVELASEYPPDYLKSR